MKLGMVLSSGGPMGIAHLGALKRLEEEKIKPDIITGSSAGGIIGGLYASGLSIDELIEISLGNEINQIFSDYTIFGLYRKGFGPIKGKRLLNMLRERTENKKFRDLKIPFAVNAVNFNTSKEIALKRGNIAEAMRASASIPFIFKPYLLNNRYLIDGSVANPMPVNLANRLGSDFNLGITFSTNRSKKLDLTQHPINNLKNLLIQRLDNTFFSTLKRIINLDIVSRILKFINIDNLALKHLLQMHNSGLENIGAKQTNLLINSDLSDSNLSREDIIKQGYKAANNMIDEIQIAIEEKKRAISRIVK